jgi:predicted amidohydrolase
MKTRWMFAVAMLTGWVACALEQPVVISAYQGPCRDGEFQANLETVREVAREARERGSHFVVFPECFLSGYSDREAVELGARGLEDPQVRRLIHDTAGDEMVILVGLARRAGTNLLNSVLVIQGGRLLGIYDKVMLTRGDREDLGFTAGRQVPVFEAHGARFGVLICADTSFFAAGLAARLQDAQLLFTPHYNRIALGTAEDHRRWVRNCHIGLACHLQAAVARANTVTATPSGVGFGDSFILTPQGEPLAEAKVFQTELITAEVGPEMFRSPYVWGELAETPAWLRTQVGQLLQSFRPPRDEADLRFWLENMTLHRFNPEEISAATGLAPHDVTAALRRSGLERAPATAPSEGDLRALPYPGGRHPRRGFFDGAVAPQRETKVSIFTPWDDGGYVVMDVPEAIFSNLGLTYLAHTHIPTIWDSRGVELERLEWRRAPGKTLISERLLPNGIAFGAQVDPEKEGVRFELWLRNGTPARLSGLRVQNCLMLGGAPLFAAQTLTNKVFQAPFAAAGSPDGRRWAIVAWERCGRAWGNGLVPCIHADPVFPDCAPGQTVRLQGWLSFYEGEDVTSEFARLQRAAVIPPTEPE